MWIRIGAPTITNRQSIGHIGQLHLVVVPPKGHNLLNSNWLFVGEEEHHAPIPNPAAPPPLPPPAISHVQFTGIKGIHAPPPPTQGPPPGSTNIINPLYSLIGFGISSNQQML